MLMLRRPRRAPLDALEVRDSAALWWRLLGAEFQRLPTSVSRPVASTSSAPPQPKGVPSVHRPTPARVRARAQGGHAVPARHHAAGAGCRTAAVSIRRDGLEACGQVGPERARSGTLVALGVEREVGGDLATHALDGSSTPSARGRQVHGSTRFADMEARMPVLSSSVTDQPAAAQGGDRAAGRTTAD